VLAALEIAMQARAACECMTWSLLLAAACALAGCTTVPPEMMERRFAISDLVMGSRHGDIVSRLGPPEREEIYLLSADYHLRFLFYRTSPPRLTADSDDLGLTPVAVSPFGIESTARTYYNEVRRRGHRDPDVSE
jgi:hypothetical protein